MVTSSNTKVRIMDAAEMMFATNGFHGASIRAICDTAGANSAAVHYHFKNKDDLALATMGRRMVGIATRRKQLLNALVSDRETASVRSIVETIILPLYEVISSEGESGRNYVGMLITLLHERPDLLWVAFKQHNLENLELQTGWLLKVLPNTSEEID